MNDYLMQLEIERDELRCRIDDMSLGFEHGCEIDDECMIADNDPAIIAELVFRLQDIERVIYAVRHGLPVM